MCVTEEQSRLECFPASEDRPETLGLHLAVTAVASLGKELQLIATKSHLSLRLSYFRLMT